MAGDKQNRVSLWEIETPESLFIFPSLTSTLKRPFHSGLLGKSQSIQLCFKEVIFHLLSNIVRTEIVRKIVTFKDCPSSVSTWFFIAVLYVWLQKT